VKILHRLLVAPLVVLLFSPAWAWAQTPTSNDSQGELKTVLELKGDAARGRAAFETCVGCHRPDASGRTSGAYPRLSGQHGTVLIKQIVDIRSGQRLNPKMQPFIEDHVLTTYDIADIAAFLQALPVSADNGKGPGTGLARGRQIYDADCADCHGARGQGSAKRFYPMVAAQHYRYLLRELKFIRDGDRRNADPDMVKIIKPYTSAELEALADYMAQLPPPR
jgi:cytochrome c553